MHKTFYMKCFGTVITYHKLKHFLSGVKSWNFISTCGITKCFSIHENVIFISEDKLTNFQMWPNTLMQDKMWPSQSVSRSVDLVDHQLELKNTLMVLL